MTSKSAAPRTSVMQVWSQTRYGGPEVARAEVVEVPAPGAGEVLLTVRATSLNAGDVHLMRGDPLLVRLAFGLRRPRIATRGMDVAGTVQAIGPAADSMAPTFVIGDEVMGELPGGGLAEFVIARADALVRRPEGLDPVAAAAIPIAAGTALLALDIGAVADGQRVLVIGAAGGVGTFSVQLAALRGAEVWALCGARAEPLIASLGAARTFDYTRVDPANSPAELPHGGFDVVIDIAGRAPLRRLRALCTPAGALVIVSGEGSRVSGPLGRMLRAGMLGLTRGARIRLVAAKADTRATATLAALAADGAIAPVVERTWPLAEAGAALAHIDAGHTVGKIVVIAGAS